MTTSALTKFLSIFSSTSIAIVAVMSSAKADIFDANVYCRVTGIRTGQLALRHDSTKTAFAGLSNGDRVQAIGGSPGKGNTWYSIKILQGSNPKFNGKEGVVNAKYLTCDWYDFDGKFIRRE
jgi:hypothetical protein